MRFHAYLEDILGSETKVRLLRLLAAHPTRALTGREVAHELRVSPWYAGKLLKRYEEYGLLTRRPVGRSFLWSLNTAHALFAELQRLFASERHSCDELAAYLKQRLTKRPITRLSLFGSIARAAERAQSDIDVLVVCEDGRKQQATALVDACAEQAAARYGNTLAPLIYEQSEFRRKRTTQL